MNNLVSSLQNIKNDIRRKKIFSKLRFSLPSNLPKEDFKRDAKKLSKFINIDLVALLKTRKSVDVDIQSYTKALRDKKKRAKLIDTKLKAFKGKNIEKNIYKYFNKIIDKLPVEHVELIDPAVTIFTTSIFKKEDKIMGAYKIWIDWGKQQHGDAIRIVNLHHDAGGHPHPCVGSDGRICEGNAGMTFQKYYREKDIYNLLESLIGFLLSDNINSGYITRWESFFSQLQDKDMETVFSRRRIVPTRIDVQTSHVPF